MAKEIKIVDSKDLKPKKWEDGFSFLSLITKSREHVDTVTVGISIIDAGKYFPDVYYDDHDEIVYQLEGDATITWEGRKVEFHPGMIIYIPKGAKYNYQCGPTQNRHLVIWAPAFDHYD